ncbi:MAG: DMT family transporter [Cyanobacteria bacterium J06621_11]
MTLRQWLLLCIPAFFWGSAFILMKIALPTFSPLVIVTGRMCVAALVLNLILRQQDKQWPTDIAIWLECAALSLINNLVPFGLVVWGQQYINASLAAILIASAPVFTVVIASVIGKERLTWLRGSGVLLSFSGVVILIGPQVLQGIDLKGLGELAMLGAALCYSLAGFWGQRFRAVPAELVSAMTITMGALIVLPILLITGDPWAALGFVDGSLINWPWAAMLSVVALGVFSTAIAYIVYFKLLAEVGVVNTSLVSFLVPLSALVMSLIFLREQLSLDAIAGMSLILAGLGVLDGRLLKRLRSFT